ncbi:MAG: hypothetical protein AAF548_01585 [Actinomycetota bacterium]
MTRRFTLLTIVALVAVACAEDPPASPWATDDPATTTTTLAASIPTPAESPDSAEPSAPTAIIDDECWGAEDRCGRLLVPASPGSPDRVEISFRVWGAGAPGDPLVSLSRGADDGPIVDPTELGDRTVIELGARGIAPVAPAISCPEWRELATDAEPEALTAATAACIARLSSAGIDPATTGRTQQAADVVASLQLLGVERYDIVAGGSRADLVPLLRETTAVGRVVLIEPQLSSSDPILYSLDALSRALDHAWARCTAADGCDPVGTLDEFLDAVADLDVDPVPYTPAIDDAEYDIDAAWMVSALHREAGRPATVGFLPEIHRALIDRDATVLSRFVSSSNASASANWMSRSCARLTIDGTDLDGFPDALRVDGVSSLDFLAATCAVWPHEDETPLAHTGGLVLGTDSTPHLGSLTATADAVVIEPTVGPPTAACTSAAIATYLGGGEPRGLPACAQPTPIRDPDGPVRLVTGTYAYDDDTAVTLLVPDTWNDTGFGTWWREATPLDDTNLDVYVWFDDQLEDARQQFVDDWSISEPEYGAEDLGGRRWLFASGGDEWNPGGTLRQVVALAQIDETIVAIVVQTDRSEVDDIVRDVLRPALESVEVS